MFYFIPKLFFESETSSKFVSMYTPHQSVIQWMLSLK